MNLSFILTVQLQTMPHCVCREDCQLDDGKGYGYIRESVRTSNKVTTAQLSETDSKGYFPRFFQPLLLKEIGEKGRMQNI
jgi:hypothetical protein